MNASITLYRFALSGHSHRVELFLSLLSVPFTIVDIDLPHGEHKRPAFLAKNPLGQLPVIEDGDLTLADSNAILVYLALRYDASQRWYPRAPLSAARIQRWLSLAAGELDRGPATLRVAALFQQTIERTRPEATSAKLFKLLESTVASQPCLIGDEPTIADVALYSYTAHAPEGGVSLAPYPAIRAWLQRIESLPGFVPMQKAFAP